MVENVKFEDLGEIGIITIRQESDLNPLDVETLEYVRKSVEGSGKRALVLRGSDRAFSAGANISKFTDLTPQRAYEFALRGHDVMDAIASYPGIVIAAIKGFALGGGFELALACDFRVCDSKAKMGLPEINLGIIPGWGGTQRLKEIIGSSRALEIAASGRYVGADEAFSLGIVSSISDDPVSKAIEMAKGFAEKAPISLARIKRLIRGTNPDLMKSEQELFASMFETADAAEGVRAFREKRKAKFRGE